MSEEADQQTRGISHTSTNGESQPSPNRSDTDVYVDTDREIRNGADGDPRIRIEQAYIDALTKLHGKTVGVDALHDEYVLEQRSRLSAREGRRRWLRPKSSSSSVGLGLPGSGLCGGGRCDGQAITAALPCSCRPRSSAPLLDAAAVTSPTFPCSAVYGNSQLTCSQCDPSRSALVGAYSVHGGPRLYPT